MQGMTIKPLVSLLRVKREKQKSACLIEEIHKNVSVSVLQYLDPNSVFPSSSPNIFNIKVSYKIPPLTKLVDWLIDWIVLIDYLIDWFMDWLQVTDHIMAGVEEISGHTGENAVRVSTKYSQVCHQQ